MQLKLQNITFLNAKRYNKIRTIMLSETANYCVPDLNTVLFGIPASDFHTNYRNTVTVQKYIFDSKRIER